MVTGLLATGVAVATVLVLLEVGVGLLLLLLQPVTILASIIDEVKIKKLLLNLLFIILISFIPLVLFIFLLLYYIGDLIQLAHENALVIIQK
jgi:hypothetical protein